VSTEPLLVVEGLRLGLVAAGRERILVDGVSFQIRPREAFGLAGESGSGKSLSALAILGLLPPGIRVLGGSVRFAGTELLGRGESFLRPFRGGRIAIVFQEAMSAFNPVLRVGRQVEESLEVHRPELGRAQRKDVVRDLLSEVGLTEPERVARSYPHELSGGMLQRALLAMALAGEPELLIADEPTTALDVTVQARILDRLAEIRLERELALLWISHDFAVLARICSRLAVMRQGRIVEEGDRARILKEPRESYTRALLAAVPRWEARP